MATRVLLAAGLMLCLGGRAAAQHAGHEGHGEGAPAKGPAQLMKSKTVQSQTVEGYLITFDVMSMAAHMAMPGMKGSMSGADHSANRVIMVTVQDTASKEIASDAKVTYTLLSPSGMKEDGTLIWSGDHYGGGFSPKGKGTYQLQLKVEYGGMEREAEFIYEAK